MTDYLRGHEIRKRSDGKFVYCDNGELTAYTWMNRPCGYCGKDNTKEGHGGCLGTLPNVMNACCGHGNINEAYVQYWDRTVVSGKEVIEIMEQGIEKMNNLLMKTKAWAKVRNLDTADPNKQMLKLIEEVGELAEGLAKDNVELIIDAIGDVQVVLVILSEQLGLSIEDCWSIAYDEIKDRKGAMKNGVFVKSEDLK